MFQVLTVCRLDCFRTMERLVLISPPNAGSSLTSPTHVCAIGGSSTRCPIGVGHFPGPHRVHSVRDVLASLPLICLVAAVIVISWVFSAQIGQCALQVNSPQDRAEPSTCEQVIRHGEDEWIFWALHLHLRHV